jgi:hypothetical protein
MSWPDLDYAADHGTYETLHLMTQIVGKTRLAATPWVNHGWQVTLYVTPRGLSTSAMPHGEGVLDLEFDFVDGVLRARVSDGASASLALAAQPIADFHAAYLAMLEGLGVRLAIDGTPNEIPDPVPFAQDFRPRVYDPETARRLWRVLMIAHRQFALFRTAFLGKASPVHFFWGSFDLATTRFSGRRAPRHPGGVPHLPDAVTREAYSHEEWSAGFWPGGPETPYAMFYAYAYPEPAGFRAAQGLPAEARFDETLGEYVLPYDRVVAAADPQAVVQAFLSATYGAAADGGAWDRDALECSVGQPRTPRVVA